MRMIPRLAIKAVLVYGTKSLSVPSSWTNQDASTRVCELKLAGLPAQSLNYCQYTIILWQIGDGGPDPSALSWILAGSALPKRALCVTSWPTPYVPCFP